MSVALHPCYSVPHHFSSGADAYSLQHQQYYEDHSAAVPIDFGRPDLGQRRQSIASIRHLLIDGLDDGRGLGFLQGFVPEAKLPGDRGWTEMHTAAYIPPELTRRASDSHSETSSTDVSSRDYTPSDTVLPSAWPSAAAMTSQLQLRDRTDDTLTEFPFPTRENLSYTAPKGSSPSSKGSRITSHDVAPGSTVPAIHHPMNFSASVQPAGSSRAPISRITKACNACRSRKVRCDAGAGTLGARGGGESPCSRCSESGVGCEYSLIQRRRGPAPGTTRGGGLGGRKASGTKSGRAVSDPNPSSFALDTRQTSSTPFVYGMGSGSLAMRQRCISQPELYQARPIAHQISPYARPYAPAHHAATQQHHIQNGQYYNQQQQQQQHVAYSMTPMYAPPPTEQPYLQSPARLSWNGMSRSVSSSVAYGGGPTYDTLDPMSRSVSSEGVHATSIRPNTAPSMGTWLTFQGQGMPRIREAEQMVGSA